jgi:hypothetical protein
MDIIVPREMFELKQAYRKYFSRELLRMRRDPTVPPQNRIKHIEQKWQTLSQDAKMAYLTS